MASNIEVEADLREGASVPSVGEVYQQLTGLDVSESSPISPNASEAAVVVRGDSLVARVQGHEGEWSGQSEQAVLRAIEGIDGVTGAEVVAGGHEQTETETETETGDAAEAKTTPATSLSGVGPGRGETLAEAGIETVADVTEAGVDGLVEVGISEGVAENIVAEAE